MEGTLIAAELYAAAPGAGNGDALLLSVGDTRGDSAIELTRRRHEIAGTHDVVSIERATLTQELRRRAMLESSHREPPTFPSGPPAFSNRWI